MPDNHICTSCSSTGPLSLTVNRLPPPPPLQPLSAATDDDGDVIAASEEEDESPTEEEPVRGDIDRADTHTNSLIHSLTLCTDSIMITIAFFCLTSRHSTKHAKYLLR